MPPVYAVGCECHGRVDFRSSLITQPSINRNEYEVRSSFSKTIKNQQLFSCKDLSVISSKLMRKFSRK